MARHHRGRIHRKSSTTVESLERRSYLTTLVGGESFLFSDDEGSGVLVQATGDIVVELIGAVFNSEVDLPQGVDPASTARLGDIPGVIFRDGEQTPVNGGYEGNADGVTLLSGLWGIYVTATSPEASLTITRVDAEENEAGIVSIGEISPYDTPTDIQLNRNISIGLGEDSGGVFLGLRTEDGEIIRTRNANQYNGTRPPAWNFTGQIQPIIVVDGPIGKFLFAGTITGSAEFRGNVGLLYAGNILTGVATGVSGGDPAPNDNLSFLGDVGQLLVSGYVGTGDYDPDVLGTWQTGTDVVVQGRLGVVSIGQDSRAKFDVVGTVPTTPLSSTQEEPEGRVPDEDLRGSVFLSELIVSDFLNNDSIATAQPIYTGFNSDLNRGNTAIIRGSINPDPDFDDPIDYYALPLMGGQSANIRISASGLLPVNVGVYDPQGRLIASDRSNLNEDNNNIVFRIVAETPGIYTIAAVVGSDLNCNGVEDDGLTFAEAPHPYELRVTKTAETTVGAIRTLNDLYVDLSGDEPMIRVRKGDLGMLWANGSVRGQFGYVRVQQGNLRAVQGQSVGQIVGGFVSEGVNLQVEQGSVGLLRSTGVQPTDVMYVNPLMLSPTGAAVASLATGGNYQVVDAASLFVGNLTARGGIGTIRAGQIGTSSLPAPVFAVNVDKSGNDGFIDLIDVAGNMGTIITGGPVLDAGPGGNIRYVRVGGTAFRDRFFGGGIPEVTTFGEGVSATLTDDSGTTVVIKPSQVVSTTLTRGALSVTTLPVRSGGSVILRVTSTTSVSIETSSSGKGAEISDLDLLGGAPLLVDNAIRGLLRNPSVPYVDLTFGGGRPIDVFQLTGGSFRKIDNPYGEFVIATLGEVETFSASSLGMPKSQSGAALLPFGVISGGAAYPFLNQPFGINVSNVKDLRAWNGMGNIVVTGTVQNLTANADGRFTKGVNEGITGPIVVSGQLRLANIGEGILPSGTGAFSRSGLYANGLITKVVNQGPGTDIRGEIISLTGIGSIELNGGSIIDADILVNMPFDAGLETPGVYLPDFELPLNGVTYTLGGIAINDGAGIIGSLLVASSIREININGGFGVINSELITAGAGTLNQVTTTGLGLRSVNLSGGANTNRVIANGTTGKLLDVRNFSQSVRNSENSAFDPYSGIAINPSNDLNAFLGTGKRTSKRAGVTNEGIIRDTVITGSRELGYVQAYQIDTDPLNVLPATDPLFPSRISFGTRIGTILTYGPLAGLQVTAGQLDKLSVGGDISNSSFTISGTVSDVYVKGSIRGSSYLTATGPEGVVRKMTVRRSLFGEIVANRFGDIFVGRDVGTGRLRSFGSINTLDIDGSVLMGAYVRAGGPIKNLFIAGDIQRGATVRATSFSNQQIDGVIAGDLVVG